MLTLGKCTQFWGNVLNFGNCTQFLDMSYFWFWYIFGFTDDPEIGVARQPEMLWFLEVKGAWLMPTPFSWAATLNAEGNGFWPFSHLRNLAKPRSRRPPERSFRLFLPRWVSGSSSSSSSKKPASYYTTRSTSHPRFKLASNVKKDTVASLIHHLAISS